MKKPTTTSSSAERALRIGELAAAAQVNPGTIRYYENVGLIPRAERTRAGYRLYSEHDRERLGFIRRAKQLGLSLEEIKAVLAVSESGEAPCDDVLDMLDRKIETAAAQLHALTAYYSTLIELRAAARRLGRGDRRRVPGRAGCFCGIIERDDLVAGGLAPPAVTSIPRGVPVPDLSPDCEA